MLSIIAVLWMNKHLYGVSEDNAQIVIDMAIRLCPMIAYLIFMLI